MKLSLGSLPFLPQLQALLFISGFSALLLEVLSVKLLRYWAGNTAYAIAAVLAGYMVGLAAGSHAAGKWLVGRRNLLTLYAGLELAIGVYSALAPWLMKIFQPAYLRLTSFLGPDTPWAVVSHFVAAVALLLLPTLLMGMSFPVAVRGGSDGGADRHDVAERLYAANLAGAALGTLASDFLLVRFWGLGIPLVLVAVINALIALWALTLQRRSETVSRDFPEPAEVPVKDATRGASVLLVALAGGFLVLFQEIVWTHMAGEFLDNSVYGFAATLFAVIAGLGVGAMLVVRYWGSRPAARLIPFAFLSAGSLLMVLIPFWDSAQSLVVHYSTWSVFVAMAVLVTAAFALAPNDKLMPYLGGAALAPLAAVLIDRWRDPAGSLFWTHHGVDFSVSALFMFGPAICMGIIFPLALRWYLETAQGASRTVGPVYAANTLGSLAGIVAATFIVLPRLGVEWSGRAGGLACFALGLLLLGRRMNSGWAAALALVPAVAWTWRAAPWDFSKIHAALAHRGELVYAREDLNGGAVTVLKNVGTKQLYMNGLYEAGNDYELLDQARCALIPLLHAQEMGKAMVIGAGSGQTAGIVGLFPLETIELVDFSPGVVEAGRRFFTDINLGIYDDPRVRVHIADGRHYLMTHPEKLGLLTIEVSRLWVSGEGDLYTREFYETCSRRLTDRGVIQQWVPLFNLSIPDTLIILRTVRSVFPYVAFYMGAESGMIVASRSPLVVNYPRLREADSNPRLREVLARINLPSIFSLLGDCVLVPEGLDSLLARSSEGRISKDLWPHLEYSNARYYLGHRSSAALRGFLLTAQPFSLLPLEEADPAAREAILKLAREERNRLVSSARE